MSRRQVNTSLWRSWIRLYQQAMAKTLFNLRLLGDSKLRDHAFEAFLDSYAASIDLDPICYSPRRRQSAEALWEDFVQISRDANLGFERNVKGMRGK